ncbi:MAG TPA: 50S ribosomal protein L18 [Gammaproteobacteria bacterium]|nr:50S ribosomal protein L18 [Gammaproteobacteria bacterium]
MDGKIVKVLPQTRRAKLTRRKIAEQSDRMRLTVHKSSQHIYAQIFTPDGGQVLACASSVEKDIKAKDFGAGRLKLSEAIGNLVAERAKAKGIVKVAFDRSGYKYHGCVKALADGARAAGLEF